MQTKLINLLLLAAILIESCKPGAVSLFKSASPHVLYERRLINSGLDKTAIGAEWLSTATLSLRKALNISIPFKESGYLDAQKIPANAYLFKASKGQRLTISLVKRPLGKSLIYLDLWKVNPGDQPFIIASGDTLSNTMHLDIDQSGDYLLRIQPELLQSFDYTLEITAGPSLNFPTKTGKNSIKSSWGDPRDDNQRRHEGLDIFGAFRSPVLAAGEGQVTGVNENKLGGKVVWLRPKGKDYTLYYAHLDEQIAFEGQQVLAGDTLGLMGNTGNARTTPTHLHFGVYTSQGAVDPFPFINPVVKLPGEITAPLMVLNKTMRTNRNAGLKGPGGNSRILTKGTLVRVNAASGHFYKAELPDGEVGFINSADLVPVSKSLNELKLSAPATLIFDQPGTTSAVKATLKQGARVGLLGYFGGFSLVAFSQDQSGWIETVR